jgi:hypothetical protein
MGHCYLPEFPLVGAPNFCVILYICKDAEAGLPRLRSVYGLLASWRSCIQEYVDGPHWFGAT